MLAMVLHSVDAAEVLQFFLDSIVRSKVTVCLIRGDSCGGSQFLASCSVSKGTIKKLVVLPRSYLGSDTL